MALGELCTGAVPHAGSRRGLPSGSRPRATPARRLLEFELRATSHTLYCDYVLVENQAENSWLRLHLAVHPAMCSLQAAEQRLIKQSVVGDGRLDCRKCRDFIREAIEDVSP